eukprot:GHRQ01023019.1.p2 GENE.GHRQ01023019.1~~GHRQ01023019.1.p2  ORF type:complete len:106 (+),score=22.93 GHRQ01023019.1:631-948(+)
MAGAGIVWTAGVLCKLRRHAVAMQAVQWCCVCCTGRRYDCKHSWQQVCCGLAVHMSACHMASLPADSLRSQLSLLRRYCAGSRQWQSQSRAAASARGATAGQWPL